MGINVLKTFPFKCTLQSQDSGLSEAADFLDCLTSSVFILSLERQTAQLVEQVPHIQMLQSHVYLLVCDLLLLLLPLEQQNLKIEKINKVFDGILKLRACLIWALKVGLFKHIASQYVFFFPFFCSLQPTGMPLVLSWSCLPCHALLASSQESSPSLTSLPLRGSTALLQQGSCSLFQVSHRHSLNEWTSLILSCLSFDAVLVCVLAL